MKAQNCELFYYAMGVYAVVAICILAVPAQMLMEADTAAQQTVRHDAALQSAAVTAGPEQTTRAAIQISTAEVLK